VAAGVAQTDQFPVLSAVLTPHVATLRFPLLAAIATRIPGGEPGASKAVPRASPNAGPHLKPVSLTTSPVRLPAAFEQLANALAGVRTIDCAGLLRRTMAAGRVHRNNELSVAKQRQIRAVSRDDHLAAFLRGL
jgi:hypothetical protein